MKTEFTYMRKYLTSNIVMAIVVFYFIIAVILKSLSIINITPPCLWTIIFGHECLGCGFTTACLKAIQLDFKGAFESNKLFFVVVPALTFYIAKDYFRFRKKLINSNHR